MAVIRADLLYYPPGYRSRNCFHLFKCKLGMNQCCNFHKLTFRFFGGRRKKCIKYYLALYMHCEVLFFLSVVQIKFHEKSFIKNTCYSLIHVQLQWMKKRSKVHWVPSRNTHHRALHKHPFTHSIRHRQGMNQVWFCSRFHVVSRSFALPISPLACSLWIKIHIWNSING